MKQAARLVKSVLTLAIAAGGAWLVLSGVDARGQTGDEAALTSQAANAVELRRFEAPEAVQAVAVDDGHFYAIANSRIAKYEKSTGKRVQSWAASDELPLVHLNSGVVLDGRLYCAHSNYPEYPESSSVEVFDVTSMEHVDSHSLGIGEGSLTWVDWHDGSWWAVFAHYSMKVNDNPHAKDNRWTTLVRFDPQWRRLAGWTFPQDVLKRLEPHSCSGGTRSADGRLFCTGHDRGELYELALPRAAAVLKLVRTVNVPITGQGIALDRSQPSVLYGIDRGQRHVVVVQLPADMQVLPPVNR